MSRRACGGMAGGGRPRGGHGGMHTAAQFVKEVRKSMQVQCGVHGSGVAGRGIGRGVGGRQAAAFKWAAVQPPCAGRPWTPASHSVGGSAHTAGGGPPSRALWGLRGRAERRGARRKRALRVPVGPRGSIAAARAPAAC